MLGMPSPCSCRRNAATAPAPGWQPPHRHATQVQHQGVLCIRHAAWSGSLLSRRDPAPAVPRPTHPAPRACQPLPRKEMLGYPPTSHHSTHPARILLSPSRLGQGLAWINGQSFNIAGRPVHDGSESAWGNRTHESLGLSSSSITAHQPHHLTGTAVHNIHMDHISTQWYATRISLRSMYRAQLLCHGWHQGWWRPRKRLGNTRRRPCHSQSPATNVQNSARCTPGTGSAFLSPATTSSCRASL